MSCLTELEIISVVALHALPAFDGLTFLPKYKGISTNGALNVKRHIAFMQKSVAASTVGRRGAEMRTIIPLEKAIYCTMYSSVL